MRYGVNVGLHICYNCSDENLGIETSCDETAAAVVEDGRAAAEQRRQLTQMDDFARYGGVIPEIAARSHIEVILPVVESSRGSRLYTWDDIDAIGVTYALGQLVNLAIRHSTARTLAHPQTQTPVRGASC